MDSACGDEAKMLVCGAVMFSVGQAEPAKQDVMKAEPRTPLGQK